MKNIILATGLILSFATLNSCSKNNLKNDELFGFWKVTNDSLVNNASILGSVNGIISADENYVGEPNDYFNFTSNGTLVVVLNTNNSFSTILDSAKYYMAPNNQVKISNYFIGWSWGPANNYSYINPVESRTFTISNLTAHTVTLTWETVDPSSEDLPASETDIELINLKK